ncbi:hypothetical protein AORI_3918 [Amycolatopsis keratiniphila]|uniref:Uncharacterized protein n=1 Tax=Amycolatopsis keratiniphila TaxID=129921 RepID=R4T7C3_9PSEU|nr:hypothetical protein AORI_3918 [Amycolatopsis keratiniphila]
MSVELSLRATEALLWGILELGGRCGWQLQESGFLNWWGCLSLMLAWWRISLDLWLRPRISTGRRWGR